jgi:hypothetical protein
MTSVDLKRGKPFRLDLQEAIRGPPLHDVRRYAVSTVGTRACLVSEDTLTWQGRPSSIHAPLFPDIYRSVCVAEIPPYLYILSHLGVKHKILGLSSKIRTTVHPV